MINKAPSRRPNHVDMLRHAFGLDSTSADTDTVKVRKVGAPGVDEEKLDIQVRALLADRDSARIGQLNIIGLDKVREHFGDRWDQVAPKGLQIAESVLRTHLAPTDVAVGLGNLGYLILFKTLSRQAADVKAAMIAAEIANRLLGGIQDAKDVSILSVADIADGDVICEEKSVLDVAIDLIADDTRRMDQTATGAGDGDGPLWSEADGPGVRVNGAVAMRGEPKPASVDLRFVYEPIWDVRRKVLSTYRCLPLSTEADGQPAFGYEIYTDCDDEDAVPELDLLTLQTVAAALEDLHSRERRVLMVSPVHYRTLLRINDFAKLKMFCQSMAEDLRRDLVFELSGLPDVTSERSVLELVSALKSMGRSVVVPVRLNRTRFEELRARGFDTVATDIGEADAGEAQIMKMMDTFSAGAAHAGLRTVAHGLETLSLATLAVAAGFDYVEGRAVHDTVENPEHVFRFNSEDLFARLMGGT